MNEILFTTDTPDKAGAYYWKAEENSEVWVHQVKEFEGHLYCVCDKSTRPVRIMTGYWCRLVPENAIKEAWEDGYEAANGDDFKRNGKWLNYAEGSAI